MRAVEGAEEVFDVLLSLAILVCGHYRKARHTAQRTLASHLDWVDSQPGGQIFVDSLMGGEIPLAENNRCLDLRRAAQHCHGECCQEDQVVSNRFQEHGKAHLFGSVQGTLPIALSSSTTFPPVGDEI